ncbi:GNAT family N-acetyltransferase [Coprothermobacter platensis]|uniref:GNAT family N-acetyltransferase n=1 Tax=Coprothermobacter platensis TaxID=108819 RepID=UPI00037BAD30|nr:GNAT family N-acetyltransferase [Coprothermobacter platensis]
MELQKGIKAGKEDFSNLVLLAAPFFCNLFGENNVRDLMQYLYCQNNNLFSYSHTCFVEDESILGMVVGYSYMEKQREQLHTGYLMLKMLKLRFFNILPALLRLDSVVSRITKDEYYIAFLSVYPIMQGRGIASMLMNYIENEALKQGAYFMCLDVEAENERAIRIYLHYGYEIQRTYDINLMSNITLHFHRMRKQIGK